MKNLFLFVVLILQSYLVLSKSKSEGRIEQTEYTRADFSDYKPIKCKTDEECPEYSKCIKDTYGVKSCRYKSLICKEDEKCVFVSGDIKGKSMYTCQKEAIDQKKCKTYKCETDNDCFSGLCYKNNCASPEIYYTCTSNPLNEVSCNKVDGMLCTSDDECDGKCKNNICRTEKNSLLYIIGILILTQLLGTFVVNYLKTIVPQRDRKGNLAEKVKDAEKSDKKAGKTRKSNKKKD